MKCDFMETLMPTKTRKSPRLRSITKRTLPADYTSVLAEMKQLVSDARRRSLAAVNSSSGIP
jgi:hypothetical protein